MYLRTVKNSSGQAYHQLMESFRQDGQVKKRILLSLGKVEEGKLQQLTEVLRRHQKEIEVFDLAKKVSIQDTFILGPLLVLAHLFEKLGINSMLKAIQGQHPKLKLDLQKILFTLVACRFIHPSSKLKVFEHWLQKLYPEMIDPEISLQNLYRTVGLLSKHKDEMEKMLYWHGRDIFQTRVDVVLYDLTTLRFESTRTDLGDLRQFGYSKEMRTDCTQVVFGLLVDTEGIPLGFEVYPGNTFEGKTLKDIVKKMREKFNVRRFIFVADRGLFSKENLDLLRKDNEEFIVGMKLGVIRQRHDEFYDLSRFKKINKDLALYETTYQGDRCIVSWSRARFERDQKARQDILEKIKKKLRLRNATAKTFISNRNYRRYVCLRGKQNTPVLNQKAIHEEEKKDGFFGIIANVKDLSSQQVVLNYKELWKIEDAFGEIKGQTLKVRPVFHWKDYRIVGHLTLCFLAYLCEAHMTKILRDKEKILTSKAIDQGVIKARPLTVSEVMKELCEVRAVPIRFGEEKTLWVRTDINGNAAKLFNAIGMRLPPRMLKATGEVWCHK